jgi:hypothetical protein
MMIDSSYDVLSRTDDFDVLVHQPFSHAFNSRLVVCVGASHKFSKNIALSCTVYSMVILVQCNK